MFYLLKDASALSESQVTFADQKSAGLPSLTWENPEGQNNGFSITVNGVYHEHLKTCNGNCIYNISLKYITEFNVTIDTLGCGKPGRFTKTYKTGITCMFYMNMVFYCLAYLLPSGSSE